MLYINHCLHIWHQYIDINRITSILKDNGIGEYIFDMSRLMTKPTKWHLRQAKTQISLDIYWAQSEDWSVWADAQADPSLRWAHSHFVGFVMRRLIFYQLW